MTGRAPGFGADTGPPCVCGHPEHGGRCRCGCRRYVAPGPHADQSRGGALPAALVVLCFGTLIVVLIVALALAV